MVLRTHLTTSPSLSMSSGALPCATIYHHQAPHDRQLYQDHLCLHVVHIELQGGLGEAR
jgi:hypothetical protein